MSEEEKSRKARKPGSAKVDNKLKVNSPKSGDFDEHNKSEIENMEVHHHPQLEHKPKPWREYLLEGMMIFVAVMMGFFAESYREHLSDRAKEREFMHSMVEDLKADTAGVNKSLEHFNRIFKAVDTILTTLKADKPDAATIYRVISNNFWTYTGYSYNNRTVQQLKNSGNFRLVQNKIVADSILKYDNYQNTILLTQYTDLKNTMMAYKDVEAKVVFYKQTDQTKNEVLKTLGPTDFTQTTSPALITTDKALLSLYYNRLFIHNVLGHTFMTHIKSSSVNAGKLIRLIKKEYDLEDE